MDFHLLCTSSRKHKPQLPDITLEHVTKSLDVFFQSCFRQEEFGFCFLRQLCDRCQSMVCGNNLKDCLKSAVLSYSELKYLIDAASYHRYLLVPGSSKVKFQFVKTLHRKKAVINMTTFVRVLH